MKKSSGIKEALKRALDESVAEFELMQQKKKESERKEEFDSNAKQERKKTFGHAKNGRTFELGGELCREATSDLH